MVEQRPHGVDASQMTKDGVAASRGREPATKGQARGVENDEKQSAVPTSMTQFHAEQRSLPAVVGYALLITAFLALLFVPAAASLVSLERGFALSVALVWLACTAAATTAYHLTGLSRLYLGLDALESICIQWGVCLLVGRSGNALSIFWLGYLVHTQLVAGFGYRAHNLALIASGPAALAVFFALKGGTASALLSLVVGAMGALLYSVLARVQSSLDAALAREAELKSSLARLRVAEERSRIARDLHDGVAGELTALAWRLRQMSLGSELDVRRASETEVGHIETRIRSVIENLRHVVLNLRHAPRSWEDAVTALRARCEDLCGNRELIFTVSGALDAAPAPRVADDVQCIVGELVRNAATHADPRRVEVQIRINDELELNVSDDGTGLPREPSSFASGGLANLRERVASLGGELEILPANPGTQIAVRLPAVSHGHGMVRSRRDS